MKEEEIESKECGMNQNCIMNYIFNWISGCHNKE